MEAFLMMKKHGLEMQKTSYLKKLEKFYYLRWKIDLENIIETTENLWAVREVIEDRVMNEECIDCKIEKCEVCPLHRSY